ncbi:MAG TPA: GNAT family N-acetyltransferase [Acidimicrobiales bacterium]|nr:GNAT family N-acetyltransferase [Acidimicrobiales bacterium]
MIATVDYTPTGEPVPAVVELPDGRTLTIRQMTEADVDGVAAMYDALSAEDTYRRFFSAFGDRGFAPKWYERTRDDGFGLVAVLDDGATAARVVAEAGYVLLANGDGEFGLTVAQDWRGWLGPYLLDVLVRVAAERNVPNLEADILTENRRMQGLVRRRGVVTMGPGEDFTVVRVAIAAASPERPSWPATPGRRRMLVESRSSRWGHAGDATRAGFDVITCTGPDARCPALEGRPCPLAAGADVIVVARPPSDARTRELIEAHGRLHPDVPVVVQARDVDPVETCLLLSGSPSAEIIAALHDDLRSPDGT